MKVFSLSKACFKGEGPPLNPYGYRKIDLMST